MANGTDFQNIPNDLVETSFSGSNSTGATQPQWKLVRTNSTFNFEQDVCQIRFTVPTDFTPPVMLYYRLTNFYQNHRRYVKSVDEGQLKGQNKTSAQLESDGGCTPLTTAPNGKPYYPCGLIANSLFNDTFQPPVLLNVGGSSASNETYNMTAQDINWSSDASRFGKTTYTNDQVMPPPNWMLKYPNGYDDEHPIPNLSKWYEFQVWMRTAGLPTFSKLALRNPNDIMKAGTYQVDIDLSSLSQPNTR
jgi:LEM3 (ligand-effect modulator 3) family / CDC50 family